MKYHLFNSRFASETARILVEFLEVAITSIVFLKGVYQERHPQLREYIHSAVTGLLPFVHKVSTVTCFFYLSDYQVI
ncbi:unnamed protein product [Ilex paraguariensis]|uniref:HORMA domain-containing protein n=1 Tax=Ilex paraguariensis TaxID=185542 RepID=A0ABC8R8J0_9AQUA